VEAECFYVNPQVQKDKKSSTPEGRVCSNCSALNGSASAPKLSACARCGLVMYCSRDYQKAHWKANHKQYCIAKDERAPQKLSSMVHTKNDAPADGIAVEEFSICLDPSSDALTTTLPCGHPFHGACVI